MTAVLLAEFADRRALVDAARRARSAALPAGRRVHAIPGRGHRRTPRHMRPRRIRLVMFIGGVAAAALAYGARMVQRGDRLSLQQRRPAARRLAGLHAGAVRDRHPRRGDRRLRRVPDRVPACRACTIRCSRVDGFRARQPGPLLPGAGTAGRRMTIGARDRLAARGRRARRSGRSQRMTRAPSQSSRLPAAAACRLRSQHDPAAQARRPMRRPRFGPTAPRRGRCPRTWSRRATSNAPPRPKRPPPVDRGAAGARPRALRHLLRAVPRPRRRRRRHHRRARLSARRRPITSTGSPRRRRSISTT